MTDCKHNFLVGTGAQKFARGQGFTIEQNENLLPPKSRSPEKVSSHDTLAVIAVDENRHIASGTILLKLYHESGSLSALKAHSAMS